MTRSVAIETSRNDICANPTCGHTRRWHRATHDTTRRVGHQIIRHECVSEITGGIRFGKRGFCICNDFRAAHTTQESA